MNHDSAAAKCPSSSLTRRQLVQLGGMGMFGLTLPELLGAGNAAQPAGMRRTREKSCIFVLLSGGPSHIDMWDLKPQAPAEARGPYKPIATPVPGLQLGELLPQLARLGDRFALIRSLTHRLGDHGQAMHPFLSGQTTPGANAPYFGSVLAKLRPSANQIASYVWLQDLEGDFPIDNNRQRTGGLLGPAFAPWYVGSGARNPGEASTKVNALELAAGLTTRRLRERFQLLQALDAQKAQPQAAALQRLQERAIDLVTGPAARRAFELGLEPAPVQARYGDQPLGRNLLTARRLIEAGVRLVTVMAGHVGLPPGTKNASLANQQWDMHGATPIFGTEWNGLGWLVPQLDRALSALLEDLDQRGLLESTLVVAVGEFGRAPKIGPAGRDRGHWPDCFTGLLAGGGVRGGAVYGASDKLGGYVKDRPVTIEDFAATVYQALDVPPETRLGADGFTRPVSEGRPIVDILS